MKQYTAGDRTPYTYLIRFPELNLYYYGAQWGRQCHPENLGKKYFSSSPKVKKLLQHHPAIFEPRKTFQTIEECQRFETRFLQKVNAKKNQHFINRHNNEHSKFMDNRGSKNPMFGLPGTMLNKKHRPETIQKQSAVKLKNTWNYGKHNSEKSKIKCRESQLGSKSNRFIGYYHTPWGVFESSRLAEANGVSYKTVQFACNNTSHIITSIMKNKYLKQFIGKTFQEIGFWFEPA